MSLGCLMRGGAGGRLVGCDRKKKTGSVFQRCFVDFFSLNNLPCDPSMMCVPLKLHHLTHGTAQVLHLLLTFKQNGYHDVTREARKNFFTTPRAHAAAAAASPPSLPHQQPRCPHCCLQTNINLEPSPAFDNASSTSARICSPETKTTPPAPSLHSTKASKTWLLGRKWSRRPTK